MDLGLAHSPRALSGPCTCAIVRCDSHSLSWYRLKPCPDRPPLGAIGHAYQAPKFVVRVSALTIGHACPPNDAHQDGHRNQGLNMKPCLRAKGCLHPLWASPCSRPKSVHPIIGHALSHCPRSIRGGVRNVWSLADISAHRLRASFRVYKPSSPDSFGGWLSFRGRDFDVAGLRASIRRRIRRVAREAGLEQSDSDSSDDSEDED